MYSLLIKDNFRYISLLFSSYFSTFPRGTFLYRSWLVFSFGIIWIPYSHGIFDPYYSDVMHHSLSWITRLSLSSVCISMHFFHTSKTDCSYLRKSRITSYPTQFLRFELHRFRSTLLSISIILSIPSPTKMFQFGEFPFARLYDKRTLADIAVSSR